MRYFAKPVSYESNNSKNHKRLAANVCKTAQRLKSFATGGHVLSANEPQKRALLGVSTNPATAQWKICHPPRTHLDHFSINFSASSDFPHLLTSMNKPQIHHSQSLITIEFDPTLLPTTTCLHQQHKHISKPISTLPRHSLQIPSLAHSFVHS